MRGCGTAGLGRRSRDRLTSPYGAAGAARIFPLAAAGKLILGRKRWRDGPTVGEGGRLRGFLQLPLSSTRAVPDPIPSPEPGSCCSRLDPRFAAPLWSPCGPPLPPCREPGPSLIVFGRGGGLMRTVPAPPRCCGLRIARPHPRRAARGGIRLHPRRGPLRESRSGLGAAARLRPLAMCEGSPGTWRRPTGG